MRIASLAPAPVARRIPGARAALRRAAASLASLALLAAATAAAPAAAAPAQPANWPAKPIKLLSPSTPGGAPDAYARALADQLARELGQPVVVENAPAVAGMVAAQQLLRAPPDGYTLLVSTAGMMTITPSANPRARYRAGDFTAICQGVDTALVLSANAALGPRDFGALRTWIKAQRPPPTYSSYAPGSPAHFLGYQFAETLGVPMTHVPYRSGPLQVTDMLGGSAPLGFTQIANVAPHVKSGRLVVYATTGPKRAPQFPNVPTVGELGLPQLEATVWFGLAAPPGLPAPIAERLVAAHRKVTASEDFRRRMATADLQPTPDLCGDAFVRKMEAESTRWARIVKATGFVAD